MGINLCIANSIEEIDNGIEIENIRLDDALEDFIWKNRDILSSHIEIYEKLEPYDDMILTFHEILELQCFSETLLNPENIEALDFSKEHVHERDYVSKEEYLQFAQDLKMVCGKAISMGKLLYSIGD